MQCFNCGNDADMEVFMMVNGKMKKLSICMECYRKQTETMMEDMQDDDGNIDPEKIQKKMFDFFQNNQEDFNHMVDFVMEDVDMDDFGDIDTSDIPEGGFNLSEGDIEKFFNEMNSKRKSKFAKEDNRKYNPFKKFDREEPVKFDAFESSSDRQIKILKKSVDRKRDELFSYIEKGEYMKAASARDELRDINRKIMIIKKLDKEGER